MKPKCLSIPLFMAFTALTACSDILDTNGNGDGPNGPGALPGPPSGDSLTTAGTVLFNGGLQISADGTSPGVANLFIGGKPHNTTDYFVNFRGVKLTITETPVLAIDMLDTGDRLACGLEISGGEFRLISGNGETTIGTYTGAADQHNVLMRLSRNSDRCFVTISQVAQGTDGPPVAPEIEANAPFATPGFGELDRMRVRWEDTSAGDATSYFLGRTIISKRN